MGAGDARNPDRPAGWADLLPYLPASRPPPEVSKSPESEPSGYRAPFGLAEPGRTMQDRSSICRPSLSSRRTAAPLACTPFPPLSRSFRKHGLVSADFCGSGGLMSLTELPGAPLCSGPGAARLRRRRPDPGYVLRGQAIVECRGFQKIMQFLHQSL